jgi:IS5 family transposase
MRKTRREVFLVRMESMVPQATWKHKSAQHLPKGENGRPPYPLVIMIRVNCLRLVITGAI